MPAPMQSPTSLDQQDGGASPTHGAQPNLSASVEPLEQRVRLHITPFNAGLLSKIIPPSLEAVISGLSFHATQVSPDKGFGYVELPKMAAEKLKKKLNGAILRGEKVKVQDAKPRKRLKIEQVSGEQEQDEASAIPRTERKKRKVTDKVEDGVELPLGRRVKRGWTESQQEKRDRSKKSAEERGERKEKSRQKVREGSKYTGDPELLFKAKLEAAAASTSKDGQKKKKGKDKSRGSAVVHEFENTTKHPSFLKENQVDHQSQLTAEYVDGKGWIGADGGVIEAERARKRKKPKKDTQNMIPSIEQAKEGSEVPPLSMELDTETGLPGQSEQPGKPEVHPLEALFKRAAPQEAAKGSSLSPKSPRKPPPIDTSKAAFSFFDADAALDEAQENGDGEAAAGAQGRPNLTLPPMTPVTKRDFHMRGLRSAAPEPDTATHERHFDFGAALDRIREGKEGSEDGISGGQSSSNSTSDVESDDDDEEEHDNGNDHGGEVNGESKQESEWRKWFYEHRGENNRAWRQKRREAMKLKRQRENRRLARKIIA